MKSSGVTRATSKGVLSTFSSNSASVSTKQQQKLKKDYQSYDDVLTKCEALGND